MVLKFESTDIKDQILSHHHLKTMITLYCQYLSNKIKYYAEMWYTEIIDDAHFDYGKKFKTELT